MRALLVAVFLLFEGLLTTACARSLPAVHDGDVIFQTSRSSQSVAIQKATHSPYSHMGLVLFRDHEPYVLEAAATVRYTPLKQWIRRGQDGHYVVKRIINARSVLTPEAVDRLHRSAQKYIGRPYDLTFEWSDDRMYCSELVWKVFKQATNLEIGKLQTIGDFDLSDPLVKAKMRERYGSRVPLGEPVVSPAAMFASPSLVTVAEQ